MLSQDYEGLDFIPEKSKRLFDFIIFKILLVFHFPLSA